MGMGTRAIGSGMPINYNPVNRTDMNAGNQAVRNAAPAAAAAGAAAILGPAAARARAAAANVRNDTNIENAAQAGKKGFLSAIKNFFTERFSKVLVGETVDIRLDNDTTIQMKGAQFQKMIDALPRSERKAAVENLPVLLAMRMNNGRAIMDSVLSAKQPPSQPPSVQDVSDLTLYLYGLAAKQGDNFSNGSFSIKDPDGKLAQYLDSSSDRYVRESSHHKALQYLEVDGHSNKHRGIDVPRSLNGLPCGHQTVLFATIPKDETLGTDRRLFLKAESAGCRISLMSSADRSEATQGTHADREIHKRDVGQAIRHALSFIITRFEKNIGGARKEHMPPPVKSALNNVIESLKTDGNAAHRTLGTYLESKGINEGGRGLRTLIHEFKKIGINIDDTGKAEKCQLAIGYDVLGLTADEINNLLQPVLVALENDVKANNLTNLSIRTGREVLIN